MKTKKILLSIVFGLLFCVCNVNAQTDYYNETKTFRELGYDYQCDVTESHRTVTLYDKSNIYVYQDVRYPDGRVYRYNGNNAPLEPDTWTKPRCNSIVNNAFSTVEKQRIKGSLLAITLIINSNTGKVLGARFEFNQNDPLATIPVSVYRQIEQKLQNEVWFTPTAEGKKLNYIMRFWMHKMQF